MDQTALNADYIHLSRLAYVLVRDPVTAEVIAVDAVLTAVRRTVSPDSPPGIQRGKRKLAREAMGYIRRRRLLRLLPWTKERPDEVELSEETRKVWDAVTSLGTRQQVAVVMARLEGATLAEIADVMDCSLAAANTHLEKARKGLVKRLGDPPDLRASLTRELRAVAEVFVRQHQPDPGAAGLTQVWRSGRWRAWGIGIGVVTGGLVVLVNLLRG